jgi:trimeric autotransporter adhesin
MKPNFIAITGAVAIALENGTAASGGSVVGWGNAAARGNSGIRFYSWAKPAGYRDSTLVPNAVTADDRWCTNAIAVACGGSHSLVLLADGRVIEWGYSFGANQSAAANPGEGGGRATVPVKIGGKLLSGVTAIAAGRTYSLAVTENGDVVQWGHSDESRTGTSVPGDLRNIVAVSAGWGYNLALTKSGTVIDWPRSRLMFPVSNIVAVATGAGFYAPSLALSRQGSVIGWSPGGTVQPPPPQLTNVAALAAGAGHCLALQSDGTVIGWGNNNLGQATGTPAIKAPFRSEGPVTFRGQRLTDIIAIAAGCDSSLALKRDGTVVSWGYLDHRPSAVPLNLNGVVAIAAGDNFCLAITTNAAPFATHK